MELKTQRFALLPLLMLGTVFSLLSPLFWTHVESPAKAAATGQENLDLYGRVVPSLEYGFRRLRAGEWPLWAGDQYCGIPYFANPAHGLLQPLNGVFLFAPVPVGLALHAFLGLLLMGLFTALFLRALGTGYIAAAIGGMSFAFGGASAAVMSNPELLGVLVWSPLLYWIVFEHSNTPRGIHVVLGGVTIALMLLAGTPLLALILTGSALAYGIARTLWSPPPSEKTRARRLGALALMGLIGIALSAVLWLPALAWMSSLAHPMAALWPQNWTGLTPTSPLELARAFLLPGDNTLPDMLYVGVISLILIPAALLRNQGRFDVAFFALAALLWLGTMVWRLESVTAAEGWKGLAFPGVFSLAVLVGLGADRLLITGRDPRSPLIWGSSLLVLAAALAALLLGPPEARGRVLAALAVLLPFFVLRLRWVGLICGTLLAFLLFVDLRDASNTVYQHPYTDNGAWIEDSLPALREAEALALGERVLALPSTRQTAALPENIGLLLGVPNACGAYWPLTKEQALWWDGLSTYLALSGNGDDAPTEDGNPRYPALLNYMGVRVLVGELNRPWMDAPPASTGISLQFLRTLGRLSLWRNNAALARVRLLGHWRPVADGEAALNTLLDPAFPGATTCVVEAQGRGWQQLAETLPASEDDGTVIDMTATRCVVQSDLPESLVVDVDTPGAGILVVADTFASGWRAYVDGKRVPILKVNGMFRGVTVTPGAHVVQFSYAPMSLTIGLLISGAALIACLLWMVRAGAIWIVSTLKNLNPGNVRERPSHPETPERSIG